jgi:hypothetical protein
MSSQERRRSSVTSSSLNRLPTGRRIENRVENESDRPDQVYEEVFSELVVWIGSSFIYHQAKSTFSRPNKVLVLLRFIHHVRLGKYRAAGEFCGYSKFAQSYHPELVGNLVLLYRISTKRAKSLTKVTSILELQLGP